MRALSGPLSAWLARLGLPGLACGCCGACNGSRGALIMKICKQLLLALWLMIETERQSGMGTNESSRVEWSFGWEIF